MAPKLEQKSGRFAQIFARVLEPKERDLHNNDYAKLWKFFSVDAKTRAKIWINRPGFCSSFGAILLYKL